MQFREQLADRQAAEAVPAREAHRDRPHPARLPPGKPRLAMGCQGHGSCQWSLCTEGAPRADACPYDHGGGHEARCTAPLSIKAWLGKVCYRGSLWSMRPLSTLTVVSSRQAYGITLHSPARPESTWAGERHQVVGVVLSEPSQAATRG